MIGSHGLKHNSGTFLAHLAGRKQRLLKDWRSDCRNVSRVSPEHCVASQSYLNLRIPHPCLAVHRRA